MLAFLQMSAAPQTFGAQYGILFNHDKLAKAATIADATSAPAVLQALGGHTHQAVVQDLSGGDVTIDVQSAKGTAILWSRGAAPVSLLMQGTATAATMQVNDNSPIVCQVLGPHYRSALDTSGATFTDGNNAPIRLAPGQRISLDALPDGSADAFIFYEAATQRIVFQVGGARIVSFDAGAVRSTAFLQTAA